MDKFKPGDIVSSDVYGAAWEDSEIINIITEGWYKGCYRVKKQSGEIRIVDGHNLYLSNPTPSPIRETTRKELVAGTYGIVHVYSDCRVGIIACNETRDPINLREAAHTLNQIAEYLESKGE